MRRTVLLTAVMALTMVAASGAALADRIVGNGGDNRLVGTNGKDVILGSTGDDSIFGRGAADRLDGDTGRDDVHGGKGDDRLQSGLGRDELFGGKGDDFANAIDGQLNDRIDCGPGDEDVAGIDEADTTTPQGGEDEFAPNCEKVYIAFGPVNPGPGQPPTDFAVEEARGESGTDLSAIDTVKEAEQAEAAGLLRQIR